MNSNFNQLSERAKELRALLNKANHSYYVLDSPDISDTVYDQLYRLAQENVQILIEGGQGLEEKFRT